MDTIIAFFVGGLLGFFVATLLYKKPKSLDIIETENNLKSVSSKPIFKNEEYAESAKIEAYEDIAEFKSRKIKSNYLQPRKDLDDKTHFFYGKKVVVTGVFDDFYDRNILVKKLWEVGADVDSGVSKNTKILIIGNSPGPKKMDLAVEFGVTVISQENLSEYFEDYEDFIEP
ncbi:BRCT domain-containing protein [Maribacter sp. Hel_I_7]|uniref:BRCT domain-containing protein n=1 Tax=Maribacter sp. Hel_I_7 TaxID=1249997 RepID=UPI0004791D60|nr:BRCT domain-containing protein [Maribacter sp. Hel_I_7]